MLILKHIPYTDFVRHTPEAAEHQQALKAAALIAALLWFMSVVITIIAGVTPFLETQLATVRVSSQFQAMTNP